MAVAALRDQWQAERRHRQQVTAERRQAVQADLVQARQQRQAAAQDTAALLQEFDAELRETVTDMRAQNRQKMKGTQKYVAELQEVTRQELTHHRQERLTRQAHRQEKLSKYVDELEDCVSDYLSEVSEERRVAASKDRVQRQHDRAALSDQVQALREDYAAYGQEMKAFREDLRQSVWGDAAPAAATNGNGRYPSTANGHHAEGASRLSILTEQAIYEHLQSHPQGTRLSDIETTLGLNRFQAVDALQSLLQQGRIVQKDRLYRIREGAIL